MRAGIWISGIAAVIGAAVWSGAGTLGRGGGPEGQAPGRQEAPAEALRKLDINMASVGELERLPGMTRRLSQRIIAHRPYRKLDDLVQRKVLGRKQLAAIKEHITVGPGSPLAPGPSP